MGIDLGISTFAVCSHHVQFKNINKTQQVLKLEKSLKRHQRKLSRSYEQNKNRKRGEFCAKNRQKQLLVVQKLHARLANIRQEYIRYVVSMLVKTKPTYITIEDLNVKGIELRQVNRWYPSSKICSTCGVKKTVLSLSERNFDCDRCDTVLGRNFNASLNLKYAKEYTILTER